MRKNFAQVLKEGKIDIKKEYEKLYRLLNEKKSVFAGKPKSYYEILNKNFLKMSIRGTCLSLDDFNEENDFCFLESTFEDITIDKLISFAEYLYNLSNALLPFYEKSFYDGAVEPMFVLDHINRLIDRLGYKCIADGNVFIFVEKDKGAVAVAEIIPGNSYEVLSYNHYSLKGNLRQKKILLQKFAEILEPKRLKLKQINSKFENNLFQLFNKMNIRHNNIDSNDKGNYINYVANLTEGEMESWYDEIYQMFLLAMLELEHLGRKVKIENLIVELNK